MRPSALTFAWLACSALLVSACSRAAPAARATEEGAADEAVLTVALGGDCSFARGVAERARKEGWANLLGDSAEILARADLAIVNLESPLAPCLPGGDTNRPRLCGATAAVDALVRAGVDAVTLANNHALDAGESGLAETERALRERGIVPLGVEAARTGNPIFEPVGDLVVVTANITPAAHPPGANVPIPSPEQVAAAVRDARRRLPERPVLVLLHLGRELDAGIQPRDAAYARPAVQAGAAAVVMHGAHVIRKLGVERGVPVHLGLGNLLFDQADPRARRGALLELRLAGSGPAEVGATICVDPLTSRALACEPAATP